LTDCNGKRAKRDGRMRFADCGCRKCGELAACRGTSVSIRTLIHATNHNKECIMKKILTIGLSLVFALMTAACSSTATSRGTGETFDDAGITAKVKTQIARDDGVGRAAAINVDTYRGVVSLAGFVDNAKQADAAVKAARSVEGVKSVKNNLQIKPSK